MNINEIREKIESDDKFLEEAIKAVYRGQTASEKSYQQTLEDNGVGFNGVDSSFGSSLAQQILSGKHLTDKQKFKAKRMMKKYARQISESLPVEG